MTNEISSSNLPIDAETCRDVIAELKLRLGDREQHIAQNALRWTSDKPKVPGWYWRRSRAGSMPHVVEVAPALRGNIFGFPEGGLYLVTDEGCLVEMDGQFAGPIQEPV